MKRESGLLVLCFVTVLAFSQQNANYDESKVPSYVLPELLKCENGESVTTVEQWENKRRPELLDLFGRHMYGTIPAERINVSYDIVSENREALGGKATSKQVRFTFSNGDKKNEAYLLLFIPNKPKGKVPIIVGYNFKGNHSTTTDTMIIYSPALCLALEPGSPDWVRGSQASRWSYDLIIDRGYAIATMCYHDIFPDKPELKDHSVISLFSGYNSQKTDPAEWQAIAAWAWGSSRIVDFLEGEEKDRHQQNSHHRTLPTGEGCTLGRCDRPSLSDCIRL